MARLNKVELDPGRPAWERQPGEGKAAFEAFEVYRSLGAGRTLDAAAEKLGRSTKHLWDLSSVGKWSARIKAWNDHLSEVYTATLVDERRQAAREDAAMLRAMMVQGGKNLQAMDNYPLSPEQTIRILDVALKYRRQLYGDPAQATEQATQRASDPGPVQVELRQFHELSDAGRINAVRDLLQDTQRWLIAASDQDDE